MQIPLTIRTILLSAAVSCGLSVTAHAGAITNGGFEAGFAGWTRADQLGSDGTFASQSGTASPVNGLPVPAPPGGLLAAMTDAMGPGSHVLYQDFVIPTAPSGFITFSLFIGNGNGSPAFFTPSTLDFATTALNQQARVDIMTTSANAFSVAGADILQNVYQTAAGAPLVSGYTTFTVDLSALFLARAGQTVRLRFAEVDNVAPFNLGVDNVDVLAGAVPEPGTWITVFGAVMALGLAARRRA